MDDFMTVKDVCELLKVSRGTVIRLIRAGQLKAFKIGTGRSWRIERSEFQRFVKGGAALHARFNEGEDS